MRVAIQCLVSRAAALLIALSAVVMLCGARSVAHAQSRNNVQLEERSAKFLISPLVNQFTTRPGLSHEFEFKLESLGNKATVKVIPVALQQQESGLILPTADRQSLEALTLLSPQTMTVNSRETKTIRGRIRTPLSEGGFHSFGLMVSEVARLNRLSSPGEPSSSPRMGINFVTQYLLRIELSVPGASNTGHRRLQLAGVDLLEQHGRALVRVRLENPSANGCEFNMRCRITDANDTPWGEPFYLSMPIRASETGPRKYQARILPGAKLRMESLVEETLLPGNYFLNVELFWKNRLQKKERFPLTVGVDDFPAQQALTASVLDSVHVEPAQLELSSRPRGERMIPVRFFNSGTSPTHINLQATPYQTADCEWLIVRPTQFKLAAGASRNVLVTMRNTAGITDTQYAQLEVHAVREEGGPEGTKALPIVLLAGDEQVPQFESPPLSYRAQGERPSLQMPLHNQGVVHIAPEARLKLTDSRGRAMLLEAGYGRWLLPGKSTQLQFRCGPLLPGEYQIVGELQVTPAEAGERFEQTLVVE